jgi:hypothetical protein
MSSRSGPLTAATQDSPLRAAIDLWRRSLGEEAVRADPNELARYADNVSGLDSPVGAVVLPDTCRQILTSHGFCAGTSCSGWHNKRVGLMVRCEPPTDTCRDRGVMQLLADPRWRARSAACRSADNAEQPTDRQTAPQLQPWREVRPSPAVHPNLAPLVPLPVLCRGGRYAERGRCWSCAGC